MVYDRCQHHPCQHEEHHAGEEGVESGCSVSRRIDKGLLCRLPPKPGPRSLFAKGVHGFSDLEADAKELKVRFFDRNLSLLYEYVLRKSTS